MKKAILFGASSKGINQFDEMKEDINVIYFCDNDSDKWGKILSGTPIISPEQLKIEAQNVDYVIITSSYYDEIEIQLKNMEIKNIYYYEHIPQKREIEDVKSVYENINDNILMFTKLDFKEELPNEKNMEYLMNNYIYIDERWKPYKISDWRFCWGDNPFTNNTWRLRLHILQPIYYLLNKYDFTKDKKYLLKCIEIVESWIEENVIRVGEGVICKTTWAWNDHATSDRVIIFSRLLIKIYKENEDFAFLLIKILKIHGSYLANPEKYSPYNHGIMQDRALLLISALLPNLKESMNWQQLSINRLIERINKDVSKSGVHLEHSASYHYLVWEMFDEIFKFLKHQNIKNELSDKEVIIESMYNYLTFLINSDGSLPQTGDTNYLNVNKKLTNKIYAVEGVFYCIESGVAIFNKGQDKFIFQSGFHSLVHKHADDCSFIFRKKGIDIFIDCGMYNYQEKNKYRRYIRSVFAHNTVSVDGKSYDLANENIRKAILSEVYDCDDYFYVCGSHCLYDGVEYSREMFYFKEYEIIFICDDLNSKGNHTYNQNFNLGEDVKIINKNTQNCILSANKDIKIKIMQLNPIKKLNVYNGNVNPIRGWYSKHFNSIVPITSVDFEVYNDKFQFWTVINLADSEINDISFLENTWRFNFSDKTIIKKK